MMSWNDRLDRYDFHERLEAGVARRCNVEAAGNARL
jgi:hypothetical protein